MYISAAYRFGTYKDTRGIGNPALRIFRVYKINMGVPPLYSPSDIARAILALARVKKYRR